MRISLYAGVTWTGITGIRILRNNIHQQNLFRKFQGGKGHNEICFANSRRGTIA